MKRKVKTIFFVLLLSCLLAGPTLAASQAKNVGLGVVLGEPTGFTGKFWLNPSRAVDAGLAFSLDNFVLLYGDYLFHFPKAFGTGTPFVRELTPYVGIGGELILSSQSNHLARYYDSVEHTIGLGVRIPVGLEWCPRTAPFGIFVELVPGVGIIPGTFGFVQGGLGARYYF